MDTYHTSREILLLTDTTFYRRQLREMDACQGNKHLSAHDQIEEACWNGLMDELLPEIIQRQQCNTPLYLWHVRQSTNCLQMEFSTFPQEPEKEFSIDAGYFLSALAYS